jgi:tripartite-type tricarboxylate transporter receptor subunit TctC
MTLTFSRGLATASLALAVTLAPAAAFAQAWPTKQPIKAVIPFPPGSTTDVIGRMVVEEVGRQIGQTIIPENRPGASTTTATNFVAKADPDGYTMLIASSSFTVVPSTFTTLGYNAETDLIPVAMLANMANVTIVPATRPYKTAKDLVDAAKANPGKMNYASIGAGSATHLTAERFRISANFQATHVPFKGTAEALTEILADRIDFYCSPIAAIVPLVQEKKVIALAVSTAKRSSALPDVPTSVEAGYKDSGYDFWIGAMLPAKTPQEIVTRLHAEINKALDKPELAKRFLTLGADQFRLTPAEYADLIKREIKSNGELVKAIGLKGGN